MIYKHRSKFNRIKLALSIYWNHTKELFNNIGQVIGLYNPPVIPTEIDFSTISPALEEDGLETSSWPGYRCNTFSGGDTVILFNGKINGCIQGFKYDINPTGNTGIMDIDIIATAGGIEYPEKNSNMIVSYANEYGDKAYQVFELLDCININSCTDADSIQQTVHLKYNCTGTGKYIKTDSKIFDMDEHSIITTVWEKLENTVNEKERDILLNMRGGRIHFCEKCYLDYLINKHGFKFPEEE